MRRRLALFAASIATLALLAGLLTIGSASGSAPAAPGGRCRVPALRGLTLDRARRRAADAGCRLHRRGARLQDPSIQTIRRQLPAGGARAALVVVTLNPLCYRTGLVGPPAGEPLLTSGPTELVSGIYLEGGPLILYSAPRCRHPAGIPVAGTITVRRAGGPIVSAVRVAQGGLATITLPAGHYDVSGVAHDGGRTLAAAVVIPPGETVRQDVAIPVP